MSDRTENGAHAADTSNRAQQDAVDGQADPAIEAQQVGQPGQPLEKLSFGLLLTQRPQIDTSKTTLQDWLRHFMLMMAVYVPFDLILSLLGSTVQIIAFWWFVVGLHLSVQVVQFRTRQHIPMIVNTFPKAVKLFFMTIAWPVLFR